jgi:hypothetical protein
LSLWRREHGAVTRVTRKLGGFRERSLPDGQVKAIHTGAKVTKKVQHEQSRGFSARMNDDDHAGCKCSGGALMGTLESLPSERKHSKILD